MFVCGVLEKMQRIYACIDMKCFFASVECAERGLNPFETDLAVADESRGNGSICLAITPKMKASGVKNRCRIFEIPKNIKYITAKPRMSKYIRYAADIYEIYLQYISPEDIHVYSIDECFIDITDYVKISKKTPKEFVKMLMDEIALKTHIPSAAGIGTNLFLAKIALDITAKHTPDRLGFLDEEIYKKTLWEHTPITDFWGINKGTEKRLGKMYIKSMRDITLVPERLLYKEFGVNAELLIDHAWGRESCTMKDIKAYKSKSRSISNSQILFSDYDCESAKLVLNEMALGLCQTLIKNEQIAGGVFVEIRYSKEIREPTGASKKMHRATNVYSQIKEYVNNIFESTTDKTMPIRKISIGYYNLSNECCEGYDVYGHNFVGKRKTFGKNGAFNKRKIRQKRYVERYGFAGKGNGNAEE